MQDCRVVLSYDGKQIFSAQWYYRPDDTAIKTCVNLIDNKQDLFSEVKDDNPLHYLEKKIRIMFLPFKVDNILKSKDSKLRVTSDYYYDKM